MQTELNVLDIDYLKKKAKEIKKTPNKTTKSAIRRARRILKILERDDFRCVRCGNKKDLTIEHPNGRKFAKYDNFQKYNLKKCVTYCKKCHLKKNRGEDIVTLKQIKFVDKKAKDFIKRMEVKKK